MFSCQGYGYTRRWGYICWGSRSETKYSFRSTCMAIRRRRVASAPRVLTQACVLSAARVPRRSVPTLLHDATMAGSFPLSGFVVVVVILLFGAAFFFFRSGKVRNITERHGVGVCFHHQRQGQRHYCGYNCQDVVYTCWYLEDYEAASYV